MADIHLSSGADSYVQTDRNRFDTVYGEAGNDTIRMFRGTAMGGPGDDRLERIADVSINPQEFGVAYFLAGDNLKVNLAEGWAEDGQGGRDTLVAVRMVHGNGSRNAWVLGDDNDNLYATNGGDDTFIGGGGNDTVWVTGAFRASPSSPWLTPTLANLDIQTSPDGRNATIRTNTGGDDILIRTTDVETIKVESGTQPGTWLELPLGNFITPQTMAEQAIAAGGELRWNAGQAMGSAVTLSFSFVTAAPASGVGASGFRVLSEAERVAVRDILNKTSQITQLNFTEVGESGGTVGQLRFGVSQQSATKGVSALPGTAGDAAGDVWMDVESMLALAPGSEGYQALLHEIGHALGLRHPRNVDAGDSWAMQLRVADDRPDMTVMSQATAPDGLFRSDWGPLDVLALRSLYGRRDTATGNDVYTLGADSRSLHTVVDDAGSDTLDASALTAGVLLDLQTAHGSSLGLTPAGLAACHNLNAIGSNGIENAVGSAYNDVLIGNAAANVLTGGAGNDWIDGGDGLDRAAYAGNRAAYAVTRGSEQAIVSAVDGIGGSDTLLGIERLQFGDRNVALDIDGAAGSVAQILRALFGPAALNEALYVGIGLSLFDGGLPYAEIVRLAVGTDAFEVLAGGRSNAAFVNAVYRNVVGVLPGAGDLANFTGLLDRGEQTQASLALLACQIEVNTRSAELMGLASTGLDYLPYGS